ncbi:hypothetical protein BU14_0357s0013 [Porphyra umbilicalis]|uniref:Hedgehog protein Hint domain-containing protein n=1 Tax=Porphyra umbilicalis TaxID=2786 RepID=A0A1X6NXR4_PORUM|nr:hypothetical protein BU14_0357s0013 [Porphyra umbilicalis]|eukprot:OSX73320.1 hypothetical protein BU14_0357s0013 [Porphyra umbilicalis]
MDRLALGDRLAVTAVAGAATSSSLLMGWTHRDATAVRRFVAVTYELDGGDGQANTTTLAAAPTRRTLRASAGHYLEVELYTYAGDLVPAAAVAVRDALAAAAGGPARVVAVSIALDVGLYNPHPAAGVLIVDGLRVSAYTTAVLPALAHAALAPARAAVGLGVVDPLGWVWRSVAVAERFAGGVSGWWTTAGRLIAAGSRPFSSDVGEL